MTWLIFYALIKYWIPILTALGILWRGITGIKRGVKDFADTLLDNHLQHIQIAVEKSSEAVISLCETQKDSSVSIVRISEDLRDHQKEDIRVQTAILTGIEFIKAKVH